MFFGVGSVFANFFESAHSIMVLNNGTTGNLTSELSEAVTRRHIGGLPINILFMLIIFVLCYLCLVIVLICYGTILRTIRQFHSSGDTKGKFNSEESQKFNRNTLRNVNVEIDKEGKSASVIPPNSSGETAVNAQQP
jgi:cell division septal protein FtsQ